MKTDTTIFITYIPIAMKFGTQSTPSSVIINMTFKIVDLDPKLKTWADLV